MNFKFRWNASVGPPSPAARLVSVRGSARSTWQRSHNFGIRVERGWPGGILLLRIAAVVCLLLAVHSAMAQAPAGQQPTGQAPPAKTPYYLGPPVLDVGWTPGESPASAIEEIEDIYAPHEGDVNLGRVERPLDYLSRQLNVLDEKTGLRLAFPYTMAFQQATGGPGDRYGGAGDMDLMSSWTLVGRGTKNTGRLVFTAEYRFAIGSQPPTALLGQLGTLIGTVNGFNDRGWVVRDFFWAQRLFDGRLRFMIGRADPSDYVGNHWLQNSNNSFLNRHFSGSAAMPSPGHGPSAGISYRPGDLFYVTAGASSAYGVTTQWGFDTLRRGDFFTFGEVGLTPTFHGLGRGKYAVSPWHMAARDRNNLPSDNGVTVTVDQELNKKLQIFARYAYADATLTNVRQIAQGGLGMRGMFGNLDDLAGVAFSVGIPRNSALRNEKVFEAFYRWQFTRHTQLSFGAQAIFDPSNAPTASTVGVFYARLRTVF